MKKKFILLAMMLLTLIGGVNLNVLDAQTITIGSGTDVQAFIPLQSNYDNTISEQIFLAEDFQGNAGSITSYAFKSSKDLESYGTPITVTRNFKIYMINTDKASFVSTTDWVNMTNADMVFDGSVTVQPKDTWTTITFDTPFEYENGKNVLLCIVAEGTWNGASGNYYKYTTADVRSLVYYVDTTPLDATNITVESKFDNLNYVAQSQFTFEASGPEVMPSSVPEITSIEATHNSVTLSWDAVENAKQYNVYTSTGDIVTVKATSCTLEGLEDLTEYCYQVSAVNGEFETAKSTESCVTTLEYIDPFIGKQFRIKALTYNTKNSNDVVSGPYSFTSPMYLNISSYNEDDNPYINAVAYAETPEQVFAFEPTGNENEYYLRSASGYYIKCYKWNMGAPSTNVADASPLRVSYIDETTFYLMNGRSSDEYIKVETSTNDYVNYRLYCDFKDQAKAAKWTFEEVLPEAPTAPTLSANAISATAVLLSWDAVFGADTYTVYEGTTVIAENITETNYIHEGLTASTTYNYTVTATNEIGTSEASNTATATTWAPAPETAPANLQATKVTYNSVTLTWDVVDGATYYEIYKDAVYLDQTNTTTYTAIGLSAETSYNFTVKAGNNSGTSPESEAISVTTEQFIGRTVVFELNDYYSSGNYDGWNNNKLSVVLSTGEVYEYTNSGSAATEYYYLDVPYGTTVTVTYLKIGSYPSENTYYIRYNDDKSLIYQDGRAVNGGNAPTANSPFSFTVKRPGPENLAIVEGEKTQLYPGETTEISWDDLDGAISYNVYVNDVKFNTEAVEGFPYELVNLPYGMNTIAVAAVFADDSESGMSNTVTVQVAGTFTLTVNVTDGTYPIVGATVEIDMTSAYDEFFNKLEMEVEPLTTNAQGVANITLPLLAKNYDYYGGMWLTPLYTVKASKTPYSDNESDVYCTYISNLQTVERELVLTLPKPDIVVKDEKGEYLYGDVMVGTKVVLSWDKVEGADAYKVYKLNAGEVESSETVTDTTYTIEEGVWKGHQYAVSALFGELESEKTEAYFQVKGNGYFKGYVTDDTKALQGIQVKVSSEYGDASVVVTTDESGRFEGEIMEGNYILTISHSDYEEFTSETFTIGYEAESDFGTITLTAKPSASDITEVTATLNGENVDVEWTVTETSTYTKYNVYRRLAGTQGKGDNIAQNVEATSTTDAEWETLDPGTYQYGVAAFVDNTISFTQGFNGGVLPDGWTQSNSKGYTIENSYTWAGTTLQYGEGRGSVYFYKYSNTSGCEHRLISPAIDLGTSGNATLKFKYYIWSSYGSGYSNTLSVRVATSPDGPWDNVAWNDSYYTGQVWQDVECVLPYTGTVYVAFSTTLNYCYTYLDAVEIIAGSSYETQIVWSDEVVKQGPNTFEGTVSTDWNEAENWSHGNVPAAGDKVIVNAEAVISGNVELSTLDIVGNGSVTVDANASLTVTGAITQEQYYSLIMNDGAQVFQNNANVTAQFNMNLVNPSGWSTSNKDGWQFISSPLSNVNVTNIAEGNYDLYKYDGEKENEWLNHKDVNFADDTYQHHIGYLASHETKTTLEFKGTLNYNDYNGSYAFYDFVEYYENEPLKNFYLIGNPYPFNISWADFKNNKGMFNGYAYVKEDGNYEYATSGEIAVGDGFFVQAISGTPDDQYSTLYYYLKGSGNTRSTKESNNSLNITATGNAGEDNVIINLAGKSEGFNKLQNFNDAIATVYVAEDGKNYGIYNCDADVQEVELSFNANKMGNYTISIEPNGKFQTVTLVDRFTGVETNMLVEDYNFTAMSEENPNRFIVRFANGQQTTDNSHFVYQSGEELILNIQGEVQIVDVLGRVVYNGEAMNDINRINVSSFNSGAYMVKVMNGNEVKVEKVVIY